MSTTSKVARDSSPCSCARFFIESQEFAVANFRADLSDTDESRVDVYSDASCPSTTSGENNPININNIIIIVVIIVIAMAMAIIVIISS